MKIKRLLVAAAALMTGLSLYGQSAGGVIVQPSHALPEFDWPKFNLDFKGGPPGQLVEAVEKASGDSAVNVIIPEAINDVFLPPLKLRDVNIAQLFHAIGVASTKTEWRRSPGNPPQQVTTSYGFRTADRPPTPNSIWYFYVDGPPAMVETQRPAPQVRFWNLEALLEKLKVEDVTTAVETGWKMLGINPVPKLTFHKDTKLLVVVGQQTELAVVDDVLKQLTPGPKEPNTKSSQSAPPRPTQ